MERLPRPTVTPSPVPVLSDKDIRALLTTCNGTKSFIDRRDAAILRLFADCGLRRGELAGLSTADVDMDSMVVIVTGKGRRRRVVPFGVKSAQALAKYLRVRQTHKNRDLPALWLGQRGDLGYSGYWAMIRRRARRAGLGDIHPHQFRHTFAHVWLTQGGGEGEL
ncbi:MAG: tyrosine-type recombinase/integrase [Actinobacteria bacterium]|nr:tyrosine-type recombinase/integrase [Actinomycetota bacterium]